MKLILPAVMLFVIISDGLSQVDNEFWFVAPEVTTDHHDNWTPDPPGDTITYRGGEPVFFHISTQQFPAQVLIEQPANPNFPDTIVDIPASSTVKVDLTHIIEQVENQYETLDGTNGKNNKGFRIVSLGSSPGEKGNPITVYYESSNENNPDIFSLKGGNALGDDFFTIFQNSRHNQTQSDWTTQAYSAFDIVATKDGTIVTIETDKEIYGYPGQSVFSVALDKGETFSGIPAMITEPANGWQPADVFGRAADDHLTGCHISSTHDIAITVKDDSYKPSDVSGWGCYDLLGDQLIPTDIIGNEYIAMKGQLYENASTNLERLYIVGTNDGDSLFFNDVFETTIDRGETYMYEVDANFVHVRSKDSAIYVLQLSGIDCEVGEAILPPIDKCTGSTEVSFTRSTDEQFYLNIMVRAGAEGSFELNGAATPLIQATDFNPVPGNTEWLAARIGPIDVTDIPVGVTSTLINTQDLFHLGIFNGSGSGGTRFGYFSDFKEVKVNANVEGSTSPFKRACYGEEVQLVSAGGTSFQWEPGLFLNDSTAQNPIATAYTDMQYKVTVSGACNLTDSAFVDLFVADPIKANFETDVVSGCAPLDVTFTNTSYGANEFSWDFGDGTTQSDTSTTEFSHVFNNTNTSDSVVYEVRLVANFDPKDCRDTTYQKIIVYPEITSDFEVSDSIGCDGLEVQFTNNSYGDTSNFYWDFGDQAQSNKLNPLYTYNNIGQDDTTYTAQLIAESKFQCTDTSYNDVTIYPLIKAAMAIDTAASCSPLFTDLDPGNSIGVDTFFFNVEHQYDNVSYKRTTDDPLAISHIDTSQASPDTLKIDMLTMNRFGCTDTLNQRQVIVYPQVIADFEMDTNQVCDSLPIAFTNQSTGFSLDYEWEFGDGSNSNAVNPGPHTYYNRTNADKEYIISLEATSDYFCSSMAYDTVTVHPYVKSVFSLDYAGSCSPLPVTLQNNSQGQNGSDILYNIFWGDGTNLYNQPYSANVNHTLVNPSTSQDTSYEVTLVARHTLGGCTDTSTREVTLNPQTVANFYMQDSAGCHPLDVGFTNASQGNNLVYDWNFGNGSGSDTTATTFSKTFTNFSSTQKTYDVTLYVTNNDGCDSAITKQVNVYEFIDANFGVETVDSCSPFPVAIDNLSSPGASQFEWDFGDGTPTDNSANPVHTYQNTGTAARTDTIRLISWGNYTQCADTAVQAVTTYPEMNAHFDLDTTAGCQPLSVGMSNLSNITSGTDFSWEFGDTTFYFGETPPDHVFENNSSNEVTRNITLRAVSQHYCYDDTTLDVTIYPYIKARFAVDKPDICSFEDFTLNPSASQGDIDEYRYYFDDDDNIIDSTLFNDQSFEKTFVNNTASTVNIPIRLEATNSYDCFSDTIRNILVRPNITADISTLINGNLQNEACYPFETTIINNTTPQSADGATIYEWNLGDGTTSNETGSSFTHFFENLSSTTDSIYTIRVKAQSVYDCWDTTSHTVTVHPKPKAGFALDRTVDCPTFEPEITNSSIGASGYEWTFENGAPASSTDENPSVSFENNNINGVIAENIVRLYISNNYNCRDTVQKVVRVYPRVQTDIAATPTEGCHPLYVDFSGSVAHNAFQYEWTADQAMISIKENPSNLRFVNENADTRTVAVMLKGTSAYGCTDSSLTDITVYATPEVDFVPEPLSQDYDTINDATTFSFQNLSSFLDAWDYVWTFGDGNSGTQEDEFFDYTYGDHVWGDTDDNYKRYVSLTATNPDFSACTDSETHFVVIFPPSPQIDIGDEVALCMQDTLPLDATYKYINNNQLSWDYGDGRTYEGDDPEYVIYDEPGQYVIKVEVTGDGGSTWDFKEVTVHQRPEIDFEVYPTVGTTKSLNDAAPDTIYFKNLTKYGDDFLWTIRGKFNHGDDPFIIDSTFNPRRTFEKEPGEDSTWYDVKLKSTNFITSDIACYDSLFKSNVFKIVGGGKIDLPNALVLNSDDPFYNEFKPYTEDVAAFHMEIYDRWGTLLYESDDPAQGWDGTIERTGEKVKPGVYVYKIKITFTNGRSRVKTGDITVLMNR